MSVPIPSLDDRTFDDLVGEAVTLLPTLAPEWTNHNPSDPGITLIELLAYFTEILVYRLGRVTPASQLQFLKLLGGPKWEGLTPDSKIEFLKLLMGTGWEGWKTITENCPADLGKEIDCAVIQASPGHLDKAIKYVVGELTRNECAVTTEDFERFAREAARQYSGYSLAVRTQAVPSINLETARTTIAPPSDRAHVSVVVVPNGNVSDDEAENLRKKIKDDLTNRCLLTTRVHVVAPVYLNVAIRVKLAAKPGQSKGELSKGLGDILKQRFGSEPGQGPSGEGWPFGRALRISELIEAIDDTAGVDYVEDTAILQISTREEDLPLPEFALGVQIGVRSTVGVDTLLGGSRILGPDRLLCNAEGRLVSVLLKPWELLRMNLAEEYIVSGNERPNEAPNE